jgi:LacI family transcriptional regulator/LacI family purine nucleotide synthesis repressor
MKVTVKTLARECSVSPGTVSRVLNNRTNVKEETRKKILSAIKRFKYDPIQNLPLVRNIKTGSIGLVTSNVNAVTPHPFDHRAIVSVQNNTTANGYHCILLSENDIVRKTRDEFHQGSRGIPCDGLVFFCPRLDWDNYLTVLKNWDIPVVVVRRDTQVPGIPVVTDNDYKGTLLALQHLYDLGHRVIARFAFAEHQSDTTFGRTRAYFDFLTQHGLKNDDRLTYFINREAQIPFADWLAAARSLNTTAIACAGDQFAVDCIKRLEALGVRVPQDVSVTGYDNDYTASIFSPSLTTVNIPVEELINMACRLLYDRINGVNLGRVYIELENTLVIRESTGIADCGLRTAD